VKTDLYFYTGTGNSLWISRLLAQELGEARLVPIARSLPGGGELPAQRAGIIFPVHIWGVPRRVIEFLDLLAALPSRYYFAVAVNAGQVAATLLQLKKRMQAKGLTLSAGFSVAMPSNYIPWGGPGPEEKRLRKFAAARQKIGEIASAVAGGAERPVERGPLWQNLLFTWFNRLSFSHVPAMDRSFWADEKCNTCGICKSICPCGNIRISDGRPKWLHRCEQCFACLQWCPREAIQYGKKTARYERYHHPEVSLSDMIAESSLPGESTRGIPRV
jgi:Pyruvate/2-oxoacid:ferredoxin oxidoreductase delta subunit